jgi:hypothetical protein
METQDREALRDSLDRKKELEYLSEVENERNRISSQIEQLKRQVYKLTSKKVELDKEWREGILSVQATQCPPALKPVQKKKLNPGQTAERTQGRKKVSALDKALKGADSQKLAKIAELLKSAGIEL